MTRLPFVKLSGAGNDFILINATRRRLPGRRLARRLCARRHAIGADGLLLVRNGTTPEIDYYNADGSRTFCGNGTRCAAWWIHRAGWAPRRFRLRTNQGTLDAHILGANRASIRMPDIHSLRRRLHLKVLGRSWTVDTVDTGVPHAVVRVPAARLGAFPVSEIGRALRRHRAFSPRGANIDFIAQGRGALDIRTYERGVEDETLACGSGVVAAAVIAANGHARKRMRVRTRGGDILAVSFDAAEGARVGGVSLEGPASEIYAGEVRL